jgi:hypothetical protein
MNAPAPSIATPCGVAKHIVNLFLNILRADKYSYALLTLTKREMNKQRTRNKETSAQIYSKTSKKEFKFNSQQFKFRL